MDGAVLTLDDVDALIDMVKRPADCLIMSQRSKRKLKSLFRSSGASMESHADFGIPIDYYGNLPIVTTNFIADAQSVIQNALQNAVKGYDIDMLENGLKLADPKMNQCLARGK